MNEESGLDAIIYAFIHYPEIAAVKYDALKDLVKIETALNKYIKKEQASGFIKKVHQALACFYRAKSIEPGFFDLRFIESGGITILRLFRDNASLCQEEIELFIALMRQEFSSLLVRDENDAWGEDLSAGDARNSLLQEIRKTGQPYKNIFAYREEGRVFVFNK